ncbi:MAG: POTRA domain-containing protein [Acidobacteriaceae bacterium]
MPGMKVIGIVLLFSALSQSQSINSWKHLLIEDIHVSGTRSLDTSQLSEIIGPLNQMKINDGEEEIRERIRFQFQEHGYFDVRIESLRIKKVDPLVSPIPVWVDADVREGVRFRFGEIQFTGNHALTADDLRSAFPIRTGEFFSRGKIGSGLESIRRMYGELGYIDMTCIPDTTKGDGTVGLHIEIGEGPQYRMGALQFAGNSNLAEQLRPRWTLEAAEAFNSKYLDDFFKQNESLLPSDFVVNQSVTIARNCRDNTVTVFVELGPNHPSVIAPKDYGCDPKSAENSQQK